MDESVEGGGWLLFAGVMGPDIGDFELLWGIAAIDGATFFVEDPDYIFEDLKTMGSGRPWIGVLELVAAFSISAGGECGRWIGMIGASLGALGAAVDPRLPALVGMRLRPRRAGHLRPRRLRRPPARGT